MQLLIEVFGEPPRPPASFARAIGPARFSPLVRALGPEDPRSSVPAHTPPVRDLPPSAPPSAGVPRAGR